MKNTIKAAACLLGATVLLSSCEFLDMTPNGKLDETSVLTDAAFAENYVVQVYADANAYTERFASAYVSDECMVTSDNQYSWGIQTKGRMTPDQYPGVGNGVNNNGGDINIWKASFATISRINKFFQYADDMTGDAELKKQLVGEMHFLRGFYYMELMRRFGGVPIITKVFTLDDPAMYDVTRASYRDCVEFVCNEFILAANALPFSHGVNKLGRATKGAALGYRSRLMLYAASPQWVNESGVTPADAAAAALEVIKLNGEMYQLEPRFENIFSNNMSQEVIFLRVHDAVNPGQVYNEFTGIGSPNGWGGWSIMSVSQGLVDAFEFTNGRLPSDADYDGNVKILNGMNESQVIAKIQAGKYANGGSPYANRDPRFYASVVFDSEVIFPNSKLKGTVDSFIYPDLSTGGSSSRFGLNDWNASKTGYSCRKLIDETLTDIWAGSGNPCIFMRLGEIYLNYAEASYYAGDEPTARTYLNYIRQRARKSSDDPKMLPDNLTDSGEALLRAIQRERRVELAFEDHRYFDVRRWKIADQTEAKPIRGIEVVKERNSDKRLFLLTEADPRVYRPEYALYPVPNSERRKNPNLTQNPGYGGL